MLESKLQQLLRTVLLNGLTLRGDTVTQVKAADQMRQQGIPTGATLFLNRVGGYRYGSPKVENIIVAGVMQLKTTQHMESTYQVAALSPQSPATPDAPTTMDLCTMAAEIMQHQFTQDALTAVSVGVLRITKINTLFFENDKDQHEENPTFNVILKHSNSFITPIGEILQPDVTAAGFHPI